MPLSDRSERNLAKVHPDLVKVIRLAQQRLDAGPRTSVGVLQLDMVITEGLRTAKRQFHLKAKGLSQTLDSEHLPNDQGVSQAVDVAALVSGQVSWKAGFYQQLAKVIQEAAEELKIPITWGGTWKFRDLVHFQLDKRHYPRKSYPRA